MKLFEDIKFFFAITLVSIVGHLFQLLFLHYPVFFGFVAPIWSAIGVADYIKLSGNKRFLDLRLIELLTIVVSALYGPLVLLLPRKFRGFKT